MMRIKLLLFVMSIFGFYCRLNAQTQPTTVTDIDGNVYKTVQIGNQLWMAENLKTTKFNNGKPIPKDTDPKNWKSLMSGGYCFYENTKSNATIYGALYNWFAVRSQKICPLGWHVPRDGEWDTLVINLGGIKRGFMKREEVETLEIGAKLKDTVQWLSPNIGATNETMFSALPGGYINSAGAFDLIKTDGYWWSSTISVTYGAYCRFLKNITSSFSRTNLSKTYGMSVRCIKN
ncbi:MAG: fibrobacter succinogenes major paralogous domain-containing protein [Bacteroidota bacterium]